MFSDQYGEFEPTRNFSQLFKGASFVASNCDDVQYSPSRDDVVEALRKFPILVDGLGRCEKSLHPDVNISKMHNNKEEELSYYLFNICFENSIETGYVTEKVFDALLSGTVPVYFGDDKLVRSLLPDPKAAIFWSDFDKNVTKLALYLKYLSGNESAYEEHRRWRHTAGGFNFVKWHQNNKSYLNWRCRICNWAIAHPKSRRKSVCQKNEIERMLDSSDAAVPSSTDIHDWEGRFVRYKSPAQGEVNYFVYKGVLHEIKDSTTLISLGFTYNDCAAEVSDIHQYSIGIPLPSARSHNFAIDSGVSFENSLPSVSPTVLPSYSPTVIPSYSPTAVITLSSTQAVSTTKTSSPTLAPTTSGDITSSSYTLNNIPIPVMTIMFICFTLGCVMREIICCFVHNLRSPLSIDSKVSLYFCTTTSALHAFSSK